MTETAYETAYLQSHAEFYDYIRTKKFYISRCLKREMGTTQWKDLLKTYIGLFTTDRTKAPAPDEVYAEIVELFPHILPQDALNEYDQLIDILNALERGKQAKKRYSSRRNKNNESIHKRANHKQPGLQTRF